MFGPLSDEMKEGYRKTTMARLEKLMAMPDAELHLKYGINYFFAIAVPDNPQDAQLIVDMEALMKRRHG